MSDGTSVVSYRLCAGIYDVGNGKKREVKFRKLLRQAAEANSLIVSGNRIPVWDAATYDDVGQIIRVESVPNEAAIDIYAVVRNNYRVSGVLFRDRVNE